MNSSLFYISLFVYSLFWLDYFIKIKAHIVDEVNKVTKNNFYHLKLRILLCVLVSYHPKGKELCCVASMKNHVYYAMTKLLQSSSKKYANSS